MATTSRYPAMVYKYPDMPLDAHVWFESDEPPPGRAPDATVRVSLSPLRPEEWFTQALPTVGFNNYYATHIIRTAYSDQFSESFIPGSEHPAYPCTVWEIPPGSGHYYVTLFAHLVGGGFSNEHSRIYVTRYANPELDPPPLFRGYY